MKPLRLSERPVRLGRQALILAVAVAVLAVSGATSRSWAAGAEPPATPATPANPEAAQLAGQYVEQFIEHARLEARNALLTSQLERQATSQEPAWLADLARSEPQTRQALMRVLQAGARPVVKDLGEAARDVRSRRESLQKSWLAVRTSLNQGRMLAFDIKASQRIAGRLAWLLSVDKRWFWLFGVVAVATLLGVVFHDRRRELRRLLNGGRARAMGLSKFLVLALGLLAGITLITFALGDRIYEALVAVGSSDEAPPRQAIEAQNAALQSEIAKRRAAGRELEERWSAALDAALKPLAAAATEGAVLSKQYQQFRGSALELQQETALLEKLPPAIESDQKALQQLTTELSALAEAKTGYLRLRQQIRGGLGGALVGLVAVGGYLFRRGVRQRRETTANTCPLCLGRNRLEPLPNGTAGRGELEALRCKNVISQHPYEECDYSFMSVYRSMSKLCFPTLGVPQAGKTHWLAMLYWELNRGNYPRSVQFEKIRSRTSEDFDLLVEEILRSRIGTAATQRDRIPHPLVFNFRDYDLWGRSNVLVNIFDYSGEVTADMGVEDYRRRRALEGDGFFFFLDPTFPSEPQAKALADFREDIRLVKGIKTGRPIPVPVAVCVSKIDILAGQSFSLPDGSDPIARFYEELGEIDPTGEAMSLRVIEARSRRMARLRDTIWPGWQIERQIHDLFGGRYMFFPLTPVGLDGIGETDLSLRTISPFGLLEPLVWLLQMNGYPVLE